MKKNMLTIVTIIMMLFVVSTASAADEVVIVKTLNWSSTTATVGEASYAISDNICTVTVTPANEYYVNTVSAIKLIDAGQAQARKNAPAINTPIEVSEGTADNTWTFAMPDSPYKVEVTVDFNQKTDISDATISLTLPQVGYTYDGTAKNPAVESVMLPTPETALTTDDYDISYINNVSAGNATVQVTGKGYYIGTATQTFEIKKATLTVTADDATINAGETPDLTVSYSGWVNNETEEVLTTKATATIEGEMSALAPGRYVITASGAEASNYDFSYNSGTLTVQRQLDISFSGNNVWATYCATENLALPEGLEAYKVTAVSSTEVTTVGLAYIPANTPILLKKSEQIEATTFSANVYEGETSTISDNLLQGSSTTAFDVTTATGGTVYVLYNNEFVKSITGIVPAGRAYLIVFATAAAGAPRTLGIVIDEEATGIASVLCEQDAMNNNAMYNLQGQRLMQPKKGLVIVGGKKMMIK